MGDAERDPAGGWTTYPAPELKRAGAVLNWLHRDHLSSVRRITDAAGAITRSSVYKPYGTQVETVLAALSPSEPKGWIGERTDAETGLTYLHARYYDAVLGRFLSPDWWDVSDQGVGTDRYGYSGGDPVNKADANGHALSAPTVTCSLLETSCGENALSRVAAPSTASRKLHVAGGIDVTGDDKDGDGEPDYLDLDDGDWNDAVRTPYALAPYASELDDLNAPAFQLILPPLGKGLAANRLRGKVGENVLLQAFGGKAKVFDTTLGKRVVDQYANDIIRESKVGAAFLRSSVRMQIAKDIALIRGTASVDKSEWHFFTTDTGGPSRPLIEALRANGIEVYVDGKMVK